MLDETLLGNRLAAVRLLILDVDGVMTDGGISLSSRDETKRFHVRDGSGIKYLRRSGVDVAIITGRDSKAVARRAQELGVVEIHQRALKKWPVVESILSRRRLTPEQAAYVGDDLVDLPVMLRVGVSFAVADAHEEVRRRADAVTRNPGGHGAVREVAEAILRAQGKWDEIVADYVEVGGLGEDA
jgi:YrbI family 3-deoxy-D-manno-octulosonate 8-phosphate phosphatase